MKKTGKYNNSTALHVILNPQTASGKGGQTFRRIRPLLEKYLPEYRLHITHQAGDIGKLCAKLSEVSSAEAPADIVIVGGDGSMNEAVNSVTDFNRVRLGIIPAGSGNDLARAILTDRNEENLIRTIAKRQTVRRLDVGVLQCGSKRRLFNISAGIGFDAEICEKANRAGIKVLLNRLGLGKLTYIVTAIRLILLHKTFPCKVTLDGETFVFRKCLFAAGMNTRFEGGGFQFCPEAANTDGTLDFCIADGISTLRFFLLFPTSYFGAHTKARGVTIRKAKKVRIRTKVPLWIHTDGEVPFKSDDVTLSILPKKLQFLM